MPLSVHIVGIAIGRHFEQSVRARLVALGQIDVRQHVGRKRQTAVLVGDALRQSLQIREHRCERRLILRCSVVRPERRQLVFEQIRRLGGGECEVVSRGHQAMGMQMAHASPERLLGLEPLLAPIDAGGTLGGGGMRRAMRRRDLVAAERAVGAGAATRKIFGTPGGPFATLRFATMGFATMGFATLVSTLGFATLGFATMGFATMGFATMGFATMAPRLAHLCRALLGWVPQIRPPSRTRPPTRQRRARGSGVTLKRAAARASCLLTR